MHDVTDVRLVDTHAEGDGGDDDLGTVVDECVLVRLPQLVGQTGMVGQGLIPGRLQVGG